MISSALLNSERFHQVEKISLERLQSGKSLVIPVYLKYCLFTGYDFTQLKILPSDGSPVVSSQGDLESRYHDIAVEIHNLVDTIDMIEVGQDTKPNIEKSGPTQNGRTQILFITNDPDNSSPELLNKEINCIKASLNFVKGFYQAISYGTSIKKAYQLGKNLLQLKNEKSFSRIKILEKQATA